MVSEIEDPTNTITSYEGTLPKSLLIMTHDERESCYRLAVLQLRERLFAIGQPLVYRKDGEIVTEFANGILERIR